MAGSSQTHITDNKLACVVGPFPLTERGVPSIIHGHPKEPRIIYASRASVVMRHLNDPSDTFVYHGHQSSVTVAKFSPSGCWVASADESGKVRVWAWDNPEHILKVEVPAFAGRIIDLDWDSESKRIVVVGEGKEFSAKCFMWDTGNSVGEMVGHTKRIVTCSYKPNRPYRIMTGGEDFKSCFFAGPPFRLAHSNTDHTKEVWCVRYSPDGSNLASVGADRRIVFYDAKDGTKKSEVVEGSEGAHTSSILSCCWSPDSLKLATASLDKTVKVWNAATGSCEATHTFGDTPSLADMQQCVVWCGPVLVALNLAGEINYLNPVEPCAASNKITGHYASISCLFATPGCPDFLTGGADGLVLKWSPSAGAVGPVAAKVLGSDPATRSSHRGKVVGCYVEASGSIVSAGWDDKVMFCEGAHMAAEANEPTSGQPVATGFCAATGLLAVGTSEAVVQFFKGGAALFVGSLPGTPRALALNHDETELAVGVANEIHIISVDMVAQTLTLVKKLEGHRGDLSALAYSPDGATLAAGDGNREIKLWDKTSDWAAKVSGKWVFHTSTVNCLAWAPDGAFLASGSNDQSVFIW
jgi:WD40 repeat protein